ncbi:MAG: T9SS type A sorting domain-containing protein [Crocinitomicaceae bacterium]
MNFRSIIVLFLITVSLSTYGQNTLRYSLSSFSTVTSNDSLDLLGGQSISGLSISPNVYHGFLPLQYSTLDLNEFNSNKIAVYPNPTNDNIHIDFGNEFTGLIYIRDIAGKIVFEKEITGSFYVVDMSDYLNGAYLIQFVNEDRIYDINKIIKF